MKVFISWSGILSGKVAVHLRDWLPFVVPSAKPWLSNEDISKGTRWSVELAATLKTSGFAVLCLTQENAAEPWIHFEAGALSNAMAGRVCPLLLDIRREELDRRSPLQQFQVATFDHDDMLRLVSSINTANAEPRDSASTERAFEERWPELEKKVGKELASVPSKGSHAPSTEKSRTELMLAGLELGIERIFATRDAFEQAYPLAELFNALPETGRVRIVARTLLLVSNRPEVFTGALERGVTMELGMLDPKTRPELLSHIEGHLQKHTAASEEAFQELSKWIDKKKPKGGFELRYHKTALLDSYMNLKGDDAETVVWDLSFGRNPSNKRIFLLDGKKRLGRDLTGRYDRIWDQTNPPKYKYTPT